MQSFVVLLACESVDRSTFCMEGVFNLKTAKICIQYLLLQYWIQLKLLLFALIFHIF